LSAGEIFLDTLVDIADEGFGFLAPLFVVGGGGFGGDGLLQGLALFFEFSDVIASADEHVTELGELGFVADRAVARDDDRAVGDGGEIFLGSGDHAVDVASAGVVDEGIEAVEPGVAGVEDVGFGEVDGEVGIGVGGLVVGELEGIFVVGEGTVAVEENGRQGADGCRWDSGVERGHVLAGGHAVAGILVGPDGGACRVHPFVAVDMVEVPVSIDENLDGLGVDGGESGSELGLAGGVA